MLELYNYWTEADKHYKFTSIRKAILICIKHLVNNETGRKALIRSEGISALYETAKQVCNNMQPNKQVNYNIRPTKYGKVNTLQFDCGLMDPIYGLTTLIESNFNCNINNK